MNEIWKIPMQEQIGWMQAGTLRVEDVARVYLERLKKYGGRDGLDVLAQVNPNVLEEARALDAQADKSGALFGLPILVKDNIDVRGLSTTAGSFALRDNVARTDAPVIANLRKAGALILGKANMTEFANYTAREMPNGYSSYGGQVIHAYDRKRDPSGSSTGSAVAVSAGLCAAAIGTDTSFSIVACAMENGVTGLKPAHGSLSGTGIVPIAYLLDSAGPITRTFADALRVYYAMRGETTILVQAADVRKLRLAVNTVNREIQSETQRRICRAFLDRLRDAGASIQETEYSYRPQQRDLMRCAFRHDLEEYLSAAGAEKRTLQEIIAAYEAEPEQMPYGIDMLRAAQESSMAEPAYGEALQERERMRAVLQEELQDCDACIMTGPTNIMHFCGFPSVALRIGMDENGMPRGVILYGTDEGRLFAAALCMEQYTELVKWPEI